MPPEFDTRRRRSADRAPRNNPYHGGKFQPEQTGVRRARSAATLLAGDFLVVFTPGSSHLKYDGV